MALNRGVVYLNRDQFDYFDDTLASILSFNFSTDLIKDLEVINPAALHLKIQTFIQDNKITPSQLVIILSQNVYFEKDFPQTTEFRADSELQKFIDSVPFSNCSTKIYKLQTASKLIATNSDFINGVKDAFETAGCVVEAIIPLFILGKDVVIGNTLETKTAHMILARFDLAKQNSLLLHQQVGGKVQNQKGAPEHKKGENKSLYFLLPILFTLLIVLVILYLKTLSR